MMPPGYSQAPLQRLRLPWLEAAGVEAAVLRLDLIHPLVSGNKLFKLLPWLTHAQATGAPGLISLGGPWSNHLHALAALGAREGLATVGLLRGEARQTATVADLHAMGMRLHWLGYGGYRARHDPGFWAPWLERYPGYLGIPEGGACQRGAQGCTALHELVRARLGALGWEDYDAWWLAAGTGTTAAGLAKAEGSRRPVHAALAVRPGQGAERNVMALLGAEAVTWHDASRGGFGKVDAELMTFLSATEALSQLVLEPLYTAKALFALRTAVSTRLFPEGSRVVFVHTGGLQGRRGFPALFLNPL